MLTILTKTWAQPQFLIPAVNTVVNTAKNALNLVFNDERDPTGSYRYK